MIKAMANNCPLVLLGTGNRRDGGKRHRPPAEYQMRTVWLEGQNNIIALDTALLCPPQFTKQVD